MLFDGALHMSEDAWKTLTQRYAVFFAVLALANEVAWRWLTRDCDLSGGADAFRLFDAHLSRAHPQQASSVCGD